MSTVAASHITFVTRFEHPVSPIDVMAGAVHIGTIWGPHWSQPNGAWSWTMWIHEIRRAPMRGNAGSREAAERAVMGAWQVFLDAITVSPVPREETA